MRAIHTRKTILLGLLALLVTLGPPGAALAAAPAQADGGVLFSYAAPDAGAVFLAGDFNGWDASGLPMAKGDDGVWTVVVDLAAGDYEYKFVVDGNWMEDPDNPKKKADPFGGSNSLVTVGDGYAVAAAAVPAAKPKTPAPATGGDVTVGAPVGTADGVMFTFRSPGAASVNLAGSFNGWSATDWPLADDGDGNWSIVKKLDAGAHQYKFVVDGSWMTDPENPETQDDGYGGSNSLVTVDADGNVVEGAASADGGGETRRSSDLNTKLYMDGRYLTRMEMAKNVTEGEGIYAATDPRFRMQRPTQSVDLNFRGEVSDVTTTFMRMRMDSDQNIIQNNIASFLDEAFLMIEPKSFTLKAFWNQEVHTGGDLLQSGGNIDLPGTIMHDHLDYGKGTAGARFEADPWGFDFYAFFANVYNADYFNDPERFDNTGEDRINVRLARKFGGLEVGVPFWAERSVLGLDFSGLTGGTIGIPALDQHRADTGDGSNEYQVESHVYNVGADVRYDLNEDLMVGGQFMFVDYLQRVTAGNAMWQGYTWGRMDVPFMERDRRLYMGQVDWSPNEQTSLSVKQIVADMKGANADQRYLSYFFKYEEAPVPEDDANKRIYFSIEDSPAQAEVDSTDVTFDWHGDNKDVTLWLRRANHDFDFGASGLTDPADSTQTVRTQESWYVAARLGLGKSSQRWGRGELEIGYADTDFGVQEQSLKTTELIFRYDRDLSRNTGLIADLRFIKYDVQSLDSDGTSVSETPDFFNPFVGFRYNPIRKLELVLAYGVDPMEYSIDYEGRNLGRWWWRQNYLFDYTDASLLDAEKALDDAQVITLRAQLLF